MNKQKKERIFELMKEIYAVAKEVDPEISFLFLSMFEEYDSFFGFNRGSSGSRKSIVDGFRFKEKEKDAATN